MKSTENAIALLFTFRLHWYLAVVLKPSRMLRPHEEGGDVSSGEETFLPLKQIRRPEPQVGSLILIFDSLGGGNRKQTIERIKRYCIYCLSDNYIILDIWPRRFPSTMTKSLLIVN